LTGLSPTCQIVQNILHRSLKVGRELGYLRSVFHSPVLVDQNDVVIRQDDLDAQRVGVRIECVAWPKRRRFFEYRHKGHETAGADARVPDPTARCFKTAGPEPDDVLGLEFREEYLGPRLLTSLSIGS